MRRFLGKQISGSLAVIFCLMLALFARPSAGGSPGIGTGDHNDGSSSAARWHPSDRKLKKNIREAAPVLDYLLGIPIKDFTVISSGEQIMGVVAQELWERYPELVRMNDNGLYSVAEPSTWKIIKGMQELYGVMQGKALAPYTPGKKTPPSAGRGIPRKTGFFIPAVRWELDWKKNSRG